MNEYLKNAIIYEVYPTSFYDSNGDGVGDLKGITEKIPYIKSLGVNTVWINPFFKSNFLDGGYDVVDFYAIDERFGTMEDFEFMIKSFHNAGIKVIIDMVLGHTSTDNAWFKKSALKDKNEYSDWFIWTDNVFNKYKDKTLHGLYERDGGFYVNYYACQPALNYGFNNLPKTEPSSKYDLGEKWKMHYTDERLKPLREEVMNIMRFWLNKNVDGFRVDMANSLVKDCIFDSDNDEDIKGLIWLWNIIIGTIKKEYKDVIFMAEWIYPANSVGKCGFDIDYIAHDCEPYNGLFRCEKGTNLLSGFETGNNYFSPNGKGNIDGFLDYSVDLHKKLKGKGYFSAPTGCHDEIRMAEKTDDEEVKCALAFLLTFKHVPMIYYGDELGIKHNFNVSKDGGFIRTGCRTPMQWDSSENNGFSKAKEIYLPVFNNERNVEEQSKIETSILNVTKKLISLRNEYSCLNADGDFELISSKNGGYPLIYRRKDENNSVLVIINPKKEESLLNIDFKKVLYSQNSLINGKEIKLTGQSFVIALEK